MLDYPKSDLLPHLHPQWSELDLFLPRELNSVMAVGTGSRAIGEDPVEHTGIGEQGNAVRLVPRFRAISSRSGLNTSTMAPYFR
jgi:hypothetical protein